MGVFNSFHAAYMSILFDNALLTPLTDERELGPLCKHLTPANN